MIGFQLGREYKLSIAEVLAVFTNAQVIGFEKDFLIVDNIEGDQVLKKADFLGGTIKIMEITVAKNNENFLEEKITQIAENSEGKFKYGLSVLGEGRNIKSILLKIKKELKKMSISSRFVNKDFKSLSSAQIIGENLVKRETDFTLITKKENTWFGKTVWVQDINEYSKRDYAKSRDMQIGMLPPKLSQMMINISKYSNKKNESTIYDPFVGLGTILIEAKRMGFKHLYGSDLNETMVEKAKINVENNGVFEKLNAKFINEVSFWDKIKNELIVTEGYLGEIMTQKNISIERIKNQREALLKIYSAFFESLKKGNFTGILVISFPYWEMKGKNYYFKEVYSIVDEYCDIVPYFQGNIGITATKEGSLLYKREKQLVGREIFTLKIK